MFMFSWWPMLEKESERQMVDKHDVKGVSEITDEAHNCITCWRNKQKSRKFMS